MNDVNIPVDFEAVIRNIQAILTPVVGLNHVDEDWGQLDDYSPNFPVQWPCALIDTPLINFSNLGMDRKQTPQNRQMSDGIVSITVANLKLNNTSGRAPKFQKDNAWSIWSLINKIHLELQGFCPAENGGKMIRTAIRRIRRDDGVQEYSLLYSFSLSDV